MTVIDTIILNLFGIVIPMPIEISNNDDNKFTKLIFIIQLLRSPG